MFGLWKRTRLTWAYGKEVRLAVKGKSRREKRRLWRLARSGQPIVDPDDRRIAGLIIRNMVRIAPPGSLYRRLSVYLFFVVVISSFIQIGIDVTREQWGRFAIDGA